MNQKKPAVTLILGLLALASPTAAQQRPRLTSDDYARAERFLPQNTFPMVSGVVGGFHWLADGRLWYRLTIQGGWQFYIANQQGTALAFDHARLATAVGTAVGARVDANRLPQFVPEPGGVTFDTPRGDYRCNLETYACVLGGGPAHAPAPPNSSTSPDGRYAVFIRDYNLWVKDLTTDRDRQLTTDGVKDFGYATNNAGWIKSDEPVVLWSPDSKKVATFQHDGRGVGEMYLVGTAVPRPTLEAWKYPLPGDSLIFRIQRVIIEVEPARVVRLRMPPDDHRSTISDHVADGSKLLDAEWYPDASHVAFVSSSRDHKLATFRVADAGTGEVRTVFEERSLTQFQSSFVGAGGPNWRVLPGSNEVLWWSQRDNWGHLYLYDLGTGALKRQVTSGSWNVAQVERIDARTRTLYFTGVGRETGRDPYFIHFYSQGMDGGSPTLLSPENSNHEIHLSTDGASFVDIYSTPTTAPVAVLRTMGGSPARELARADISRLTGMGWKPPTPFTVKGRDGATDIYGLMFTPTRLDSTRTYPIVNYIYPGPWGSSFATRNFIPAFVDLQAMAELGFVIVAIDGMGTEWRSKSFHDAYYGNMGDNGLPDQVAGMRELAQRYRFIDLNRVGIMGHSGGGFAAAGAMFRYPEFFKVGVSESGNHDNRIYEDDWGERFQGQLSRTGSGDNYDSQANQLLASRLQGKLLLVHGGLDDNVPPQNTYLVVQALIQANKDFDLIILPNERHGYESEDYVIRRKWDFFVEHLMGAEPPAGYRIGGPG